MCRFQHLVCVDSNKTMSTKLTKHSIFIATHSMSLYNNTLDSKYTRFRCKNIASNLCRFCNVRQSVKHILLECSFRNLERKREVFFLNYKKRYASDFIFQSEDAKLRKHLNVKPKCKTEDKAKATEAICNFIRSIYFVIDKEVNVGFGADTNVT